MTNTTSSFRKFVRTAAPVLAGSALALTAVVATPASAGAATTGTRVTQATAVSAPATAQVSSCFANRERVPYYSWPVWRDHGQLPLQGWAASGQGIYWYGTTFINGYAYVIGTLWGGPGDMMMPQMYLRC